MKLNKHEQAKPNIAGLTSQVQQAEMKLILAGMWPSLKPLPVFKYETDEYRATIHFDKTHGEWVCRKNTFPSNKVQELRGGLTEITMALPHGQEEVFTEAVAAEHQEQELEKDATRRLQAIVEWRQNYENGALYSELQDYLSESQQDEIYDSIRLSLTARQLQFNAKNVAFVFDALLNAGGRLATLVEIARRNKAEQEADKQAQAAAAGLEADRQVPVEASQPTRDRRLQRRTTPACRAYVELGDTNSGIVLNISETGMAVAAADLLVVGDHLPRIRFQLPSSRQSIEISAQIVWLAESTRDAGMRFVDLTADARNQISNWITSEKLAPEFAQPKSLHREKQPLEINSRKSRRIFSNPSARDEGAVPRYSETLLSESTNAKHTTPVEELKPQQGSLPIPVGSHADAGDSVVGSGAEISTGDSPQSLETSVPSERAKNFAPEPVKTSIPELRDEQAKSSHQGIVPKTRPAHRYVLEISQKSILAVDSTSPALPNRSGETTSRTSTQPATNTFNTPAVNPSAPEKEESRLESPLAQSIDARSADSAARPRPTGPSSAVTSGPLISGGPRNPAPRRITPTTAPAPHPSPASAILVTGPGDGSKPFRVILPEKPIAASPSFAMTSQLSVLVSPEPGPAMTHKPTRLQAGELVSFVWPRYPRPGDRYGSSETVKVRTTIGKLGQVLDIKLVSGSVSLLPAAMSAIRLWRYKPTLLNNRPVQAQQDVTIEFRPPRICRTCPLSIHRTISRGLR